MIEPLHSKTERLQISFQLNEEMPTYIIEFYVAFLFGAHFLCNFISLSFPF